MNAEEGVSTTGDEAAAQNGKDDWTHASKNSWEEDGPAKKNAEFNTWEAYEDDWGETIIPNKAVDGGATET